MIRFYFSKHSNEPSPVGVNNFFNMHFISGNNSLWIGQNPIKTHAIVGMKVIRLRDTTSNANNNRIAYAVAIHANMRNQ